MFASLSSAAASAITADLLRPDAYPHAAGNIEMLETHISRVFLAGEYEGGYFELCEPGARVEGQCEAGLIEVGAKRGCWFVADGLAQREWLGACDAGVVDAPADAEHACG